MTSRPMPLNRDLQMYEGSLAARARTKYIGIRDALKSIDSCIKHHDSEGYAVAYSRCQRLVLSISHEAPGFPVGEGLKGLISAFEKLAEPTFTFWYDITPSKKHPNPVIGTVTVIDNTEKRLITLHDKFSRYTTQPRVRASGPSSKPRLPMHLCQFLSGLTPKSPTNKLELLTTKWELFRQPFLMQDGENLLLQRGMGTCPAFDLANDSAPQAVCAPNSTLSNCLTLETPLPFRLRRSQDAQQTEKLAECRGRRAGSVHSATIELTAISRASYRCCVGDCHRSPVLDCCFGNHAVTLEQCLQILLSHVLIPSSMPFDVKADFGHVARAKFASLSASHF